MRAHNFGAGPAGMPTKVLTQVAEELLNFKNSGMSVMEMSHRSKIYDGVMEKAFSGLKDLIGLNDDYEILFLQGGASYLFAVLPMNLASEGETVDVIHSGYWVQKAIDEMKKNKLKVNVLESSEESNFTYFPRGNNGNFQSTQSAYTHMCTNNTIYGSQAHFIPEVSTPLVADMSSDFLCRPIDFKKYGCFFGGAQKNVGPSGLGFCVIRKDLLERKTREMPKFLSLLAHAKEGSRYNTPNTFGIYVAGLVFDWMKENGGLAAMEKRNLEKAKLLYSEIDADGFYSCPVKKEDRSIMNVVFRIQSNGSPSEALEEAFVKEAEKNHLAGLKGHRAVGGLRASIYNAVEVSSVKVLVDFMKEFRRKNG